MNNRELKIKSISRYFTRIEIEIRNLNYQNLNDLNIISEATIGKLFNLIFDYNLKSTGSLSQNFPCIDLIDSHNRISIQVTSDKSKKKIQKTIDCFYRNKLFEKYDRLIVFVLGERQTKYRNLVIPEEISFDPNEDIIDFKILLRSVSVLSIDKMDKVIGALDMETFDPNDKPIRKKSLRVKFKEVQAIKKKIEKSLLKKLTLEDWRKHGELFDCEPSYRFIYGTLNIRSIEDKEYPEISYSKSGYAKWMKLDLWDFYERGLEFVVQTSEKIIIENGTSWRFAKENEENCLNSCLYLRLPFENILEYEAEVNEYNGYPTIYAEYSKNGSPFEKEIYGLIGYYKREKIGKSRRPVYLGEKPGPIETQIQVIIATLIV